MTKEEIIRETVEAIGNSALGDRTHWAEIIGEAIDKAQPSPVSGEMGEVFKLPLTHQREALNCDGADWHVDQIGWVGNKIKADAICHAVNTHDTSLEMLRKCEPYIRVASEFYKHTHQVEKANAVDQLYHQLSEHLKEKK